jgi:hypothetical protein
MEITLGMPSQGVLELLAALGLAAQGSQAGKKDSLVHELERA